MLPGGGIGFLDLFEQPALGETEFQQQVKYRIAQEGELARLIGMIESIDRAKVSLAVPQKTLFSDSQEEGSASVALTVKSQGISEKQVETVVHLVAGAVEGLEPRRVRVTDQKGRLLTEGMDDQTVGGRLDEHYSYKRRLEMELEQKVIAQLEEVVGEDRVRVNVNAARIESELSVSSIHHLEAGSGIHGVDGIVKEPRRRQADLVSVGLHLYRAG